MIKSAGPLISVIIIDYKKTNPYLLECLQALGKQTYKNFEIILESDHPQKIHFPKLKIVDYQGKYVPPAKKRDHGAQIAQGEIVSFIDDDAYPEKNWLANLVKAFQKKNIVAVGGPGITPPQVSWQEELSGWISASPFGSGIYTYRFLPAKKMYVDDFPSMNLSVKKEDFLQVGGFDSDYYPGEDTKLCLDLVNKTRKKILYDPKVIVYHHRRPLWRPHLRQNGNFGLHRGFFARVLPQTSFRPIYLLPSLMVIGLSIFSISLFLDNTIFHPFHLFSITLSILYFFFLFLNSIWITIKSRQVFLGLISLPGVFATHFWYGLRFIQGYFFTAKLKR